MLTALESSRCKLSIDWDESPQLGKRKIQPDPDLMTSLLNFSDEDEDEEEQDYEKDEDEESIDYQESGEIEKTVEREERRSPCWRRQCKSTHHSGLSVICSIISKQCSAI